MCEWNQYLNNLTNEGQINMKNLGNYHPDQLIQDTFKTVFNSVVDGGFYDATSGVYPGLEYTLKDNNIFYKPSNKRYWRYNPFLMMGVLYTRFYVQNDWIKTYDDNIQKQLQILMKKLEKKDIVSLCSYSLGPLMVSFAFAYKIYGYGKYIAAINSILNKTDFKIKTNEDAFLLLGLSYIFELIPDHRKNILGKIEALTSEILEHQDDNGLFIFKGITSKRHQNQMYTVWALNSSFKILNIEDTEPIRRNIEYTIINRMQDDMGIIWEDNIPIFLKIYHIIRNIRYWEYYFECHQCFFAHAVFGYAKISSDTEYNGYAIKALEWIFGNNRFNIDLVSVSDLKVPHRILDVNGNLHIKCQHFKGTYEIGGYLMALADYIRE